MLSNIRIWAQRRRLVKWEGKQSQATYPSTIPTDFKQWNSLDWDVLATMQYT